MTPDRDDAAGPRFDELFANRIATIIPDAIGPTLAAATCARFERAGYTRYALVDRGSYDYVLAPDATEILAGLIALATQVTGRDLAFADARVVRLLPGDYLLAHHDRPDAPDAPTVEVMLDLSPARVPGADVHYRRDGAVAFRFESTPGAASIVERTATTACNHTYVSKLHTGAQVVRLVARLTAA